MDNVTKTLGFFKRFEEIRGIGEIAFIDPSLFRVDRQIKLSNITIEEKGLTVHVPQSISSTVVNLFKKGKVVLLGLSFAKHYVTSKDTDVYFPLMGIKLDEEHKKEAANSLKEGKEWTLSFSWETEIYYDKHIIDFFCPALGAEFSDSSSKDSRALSGNLPQKLEEFFPLNARRDAVAFQEYWVEFFKRNLDKSLDVKLPLPKKKSSISMMFFSFGEADFSLKKEIEEIGKSPSPLVRQYLSKQSENKIVELNGDTPWFGSFTKSYPLGRGQAAVLAKNTEEQSLISVIGCPGTGKSTLFLSVIANEITKMGIAIAEGRNMSFKPILVSSTANKAVDNITSSLKQPFFNGGFVFVGGNKENVKESLQRMQKLIHFLENSEYDEQKERRYKDSLLRIKRYIENAREHFEHIAKNASEYIMNFTSLEDTRQFVEQVAKDIDEENLSLAWIRIKKKGEALRSLWKGDEKSLPIADFLSKISTNHSLFVEMEEVEENLTNGGFLSRLFSKKDVFEHLPFQPDNKESFMEIFNFIKRLRKIKSIKDLYLAYQAKQILLAAEDGISESLLKRIQKAMKNGHQNFQDFYRTALFSLNYKMYRVAQKLLEQEALKNKYRVLEALEYFQSDNKWRFVIEKYGDNPEKMLHYISLVYPVYASSLVSVPFAFPYKLIPTQFSVLLADEAGMITVHGILPALQRTQRAIVVGDPKQLPPVVDLADPFIETLRKECSKEFWDQYSPLSVSAYHRAAGTKSGSYEDIGETIVLEEHRRCAPDIANLFLKIGKYEGVHVRTAQPSSKPFSKIGKSLIGYNVPSADSQIKAAGKLIARLKAVGYSFNDIGVITPFRAMESKLKKSFPQIKVGTVHKFQGSEMKVVIFVPGISNETNGNTIKFVNNPNLINVAVSRAKEIFIAIGDLDFLKSIGGAMEIVVADIIKHGLIIGNSPTSNKAA